MYEESKYKPITVWGYLGYSLLFLIPVAGLVLMIVWSLNRKNINRRNYAGFCLLAFFIVAVLSVSAFFAVKSGVVDIKIVADWINKIKKLKIF